MSATLWAGDYEKLLQRAKDEVIHGMSENARHLGANAVLSVDLDYETIGSGGSMLMVSASGTAVRLD